MGTIMHKAPSEQPDRRVNVYLELDETGLVNAVVERLRKRGVDGLFNHKGKPNKSLAIKKALKEWLDANP